MIALLRTLVAGGLVLAWAAGAFGQEPVPAPGPTLEPAAAAARLTDIPIIKREDLVLRYYRLEEMVSAHELMQAATSVFAPVETATPAQADADLEQALLSPVNVLTLEQKVKALDNKALVLGWFKSLEADLLELAQSGTQVPGYSTTRA